MAVVWHCTFIGDMHD